MPIGSVGIGPSFPGVCGTGQECQQSRRTSQNYRECSARVCSVSLSNT